jgi:hypothetical protein
MTLALLVLFSCTPTTDSGSVDVPGPFAFPLPERDRFSVMVGVDHDPVDHDDSALGGAICTNYEGEGFPACYDGHDGSDFLLDGDFDTMDDMPADIVAAAAGTVVSVEDGHYDHCHIEGTEVSCDGNPMIANHVIVEHEDGLRSKYWHMRKNSTAVAVGDIVACGDLLGEVGSSGNSSKPHLHFEVEVSDITVDPFAGPRSQLRSYWNEQDAGDGLPGELCVD